MKLLLCRILWGACYLLSLLPFCIIYLLSDFIYLIVYYLIRYRRKVVRKNLVNSFPEKSEKEITEIEKKFYKTLCDYFLETVKMRTISEKEIRRRMRFPGIEEMEKDSAAGKSVVMYIAHSMNWEYITSITLHMNYTGAQFAQIYHPLENRFFDDAFIKLRGRFGSREASIYYRLPCRSGSHMGGHQPLG